MLAKLRKLSVEMNESLLSEAPLQISDSIDPSKALILRETCFHRIAELVEAAIIAFEKKQLVVAFILARAVMETESLFWLFIKEVECALGNRNLRKIKRFLNKALTGAKAMEAKKAGWSEEPHHVLALVRDGLGSEDSHYYLQYEALSEFAHPNSTGVNHSYARIDYDARKIFFGLNHDRISEDMALPPLVASIESFIDIYDQSADLLSKFTLLCDELLQGKDSA